jgi:glutaredoxin 3
MADIVVYSGPACPYCVRAKDLLTRKGAAFTEYNVKADTARLDEMLARSNGRRTIPQIFINGQHVGGCDDLYALEAKGLLDELLKSAS